MTKRPARTLLSVYCSDLNDQLKPNYRMKVEGWGRDASIRELWEQMTPNQSASGVRRPGLQFLNTFSSSHFCTGRLTADDICGRKLPFAGGIIQRERNAPLLVRAFPVQHGAVVWTLAARGIEHANP